MGYSRGIRQWQTYSSDNSEQKGKSNLSVVAENKTKFSKENMCLSPIPGYFATTAAFNIITCGVALGRKNHFFSFEHFPFFHLEQQLCLTLS